MGGRRWLGWLTVAGLWTLVGCVDASVMVFLHPRRDCIPDYALALVGFTDWSQWALLTPVIVWLARRFPLDQAVATRLLLHTVAGLVAAFLVLWGSVYLVRAIQSTHTTQLTPARKLFQDLFFLRLVLYLLIYLLVVGLTHSLDFLARFRERELAASHLEAKLSQAQLQVLRMQLQPHFLFNTLHAISALMHRDVELADRMIARLGELLRSTLDNAGTPEVSLRQELDFVAPYLEIEQARLGPRLQVCLVVDLETLDAAVPNLLLQPLVENAIRHGIAPQRGNGRIEIVSRREHDRLILKVRDTGAGLSNGAGMKEGVGLGNTRTRLEYLYGGDHTFTIAPVVGGPGVEVSLEIPYREIESRPSDDEPFEDTDSR